MYEYKTTYGNLFQGAVYDGSGCIEESQEPDDPIQPKGKGWELLHTAASRHKLYWTWRRKKPRARS